MEYLRHDSNHCREVWSTLDLDSNKVGQLHERYLHEDDRSGSYWERLA